MAREFARQFYRSKAWRHTRDAYLESKNGLCERCLRRGFYTPGEIVHHKEHLTPSNINDPSVSLSFDNLELVCRDCHAEVHPEIYERDAPVCRVAFDAYGNVIKREDEDD